MNGRAANGFDDQMLRDLRVWREAVDARGGKAPDVVSLTLPELDALLRISEERDELKREAAEDVPRNVTKGPWWTPGVAIRDLSEMRREFSADIPDEVRRRIAEDEPDYSYETRHGEPEPDECGGCDDDGAGGYGHYCSACGKPRPRRYEPDEELEDDAAPSETEAAWTAVSSHPFFASCYGSDQPLLDAMLARLSSVALASDARISTGCATCGDPIHSIASSWDGDRRLVLHWAHDGDDGDTSAWNHRATSASPISIATVREAGE